MICINPNDKEFKKRNKGNPLLAEVAYKGQIQDLSQVIQEPFSDLGEGIEWLKKVMPDAPTEIIDGLVDGVANGSFDTLKDLITVSRNYADKKTVYHEAFHRAFELLPEQEKEDLLNEGSKKFGIERGASAATKKYQKVDYVLKAVDILNSDKAKQVFEKGKKNNWDLDKILTELAVPKEQKTLIKEVQADMSFFDEIPFNENLALALTNKYGFDVEIKTAKNETDSSGRYDEFGGFVYDENFTNDYSNLTVPGGTNYTEQEFSTPLITPNIKGHAQFATNNGIGWFRSDVQTDDYTGGFGENAYSNDPQTKTRRILEVQSDLFQKGRDKKDLLYNSPEYSEFNRAVEGQEDYSRQFSVGSLTYVNDVWNGVYYHINLETNANYKELTAIEFQNAYELSHPKKGEFLAENQFLQLLNRDNNWVTFFVKSIIQDSVKKGYEKVLFPTGNTASKVEGHTTLEEFKREKKDRITILEKEVTDLQNYEGKSVFDIVTNANWGQSDKYVDTGFDTYFKNDKPIDKKEYDEAKIENIKRVRELDSKRPLAEIKQLKQELERVETEGFGALKPIYNFYENVVSNVLKKQGFKPNLITDEYGNTWQEIDLDSSKELVKTIKLQSNQYEYTGDLAIEEKMAEYSETRLGEPKNKFDKLLKKILDFIRSLGKKSSKLDDLIKRINAGKIKKPNVSASEQSVRGAVDKNLREKYFENSVTTDREILDKISKSTHPLNKLAQQLKAFSKGTEIELVNAELVSPSRNAAALHISYGFGKPDKIKIAEFAKFRGKGVEPTILHEIIHALTVNYINVQTAQNEKSDLFLDFEKLYEHVKLTAPELTSEYALTNLKEFAVALFTDAVFINKLKELPPKGVKYENFFEQVFAHILSLFGVEKGDSLYSEAFAVATNIIVEQKRIETVISNSKNKDFEDAYFNSFTEPSLLLEDKAVDLCAIKGKFNNNIPF